MRFLSTFYFFNPVVKGTKHEIKISSSAVDMLSWHKEESSTEEGTTLYTNLKREKENINHFIQGNPENVNQITFDGLFFKCTSHYLTGSEMKKYTVWINPDNIVSIYSEMPDDCKVFFSSGRCILVCAKLSDFIKNILEHNKMVMKRKKDKYGKT